MDEFIILIIIMIVAGLLERLRRAAPRGDDAPEPSGAGEEWRLEGGEATSIPKDLQELIAEELGINLERRPRVEPAEPESASATSEAARAPTRPTPSQAPGRVAYPRRPGVRERPRPEPVEVTPAGAVISLEERGMMERGRAVSLESGRTAKDHERFHQLYIDGAQTRREPRRRRARLPERSDWTTVHKAVVWSEILGPPKGLTE